MPADVAERSGPQQSIAHGVGQRIAIRMSQRALRKRNLDASEDQLATGDQAVDIVTEADAKGVSWAFQLSVLGHTPGADHLEPLGRAVNSRPAAPRHAGFRLRGDPAN